jgi:hypothetical protein
VTTRTGSMKQPKTKKTKPRRRTKPSRVFVGQYDLGTRRINLFINRTDGNGCFTLRPKGGVSEIEVGIDQRNGWPAAMSVLLHEAFELSYVDVGARFNPSPDYAEDHAAYLFSMDHTKFGEATARVAWFLTDAIPDFASAWRKHRKSKGAS